MSLNRSLFSSAKGEHNTPAEVLDRVRLFGDIVLDPCPGKGDLVKPLYGGYIGVWGDGLTYDWALITKLFCSTCIVPRITNPLIWVNPPYGRGIGEWIVKCAEAERPGLDVLALVPARTDAAWWQDTVPDAASVLFWRGRLRFGDATASAPFPSAIIYWGQRSVRFAEVFGDCGWIVRP